MTEDDKQWFQEQSFGSSPRLVYAWDGQVDLLAAEIVRLRAVLRGLLDDPEPTLDEPDADWEVIVKMRAIAREALTVRQEP